MKATNIRYIALSLLIFISLPGFSQNENDSIYIHREGKIVYKELLLKIDSITFSGPNIPPVEPPAKNYKVLVLKVDYTTHVFESAAELSFSEPLDTLVIATDYKEPGDFGSIRFYYPQINEDLFSGGIIWMGTGKIDYPENWLDAQNFILTDTEDYVSPKNGFENIFDIYGEGESYSQAWMSLQYIIKVREFLKSNPEQKVKLFLYTPTVGSVDPLKAKWIFFVYN